MPADPSSPTRPEPPGPGAGAGPAELTRLGLDDDMLRVYRAALRGRDTTAAALAAATSLPAGRTTDALDRLERAGFLNAFGTVPPRAALRGLVVRRLADLAAHQAELRAVDGAVDDLADSLWPEDARLPVRDAEIVVGTAGIARLTTHLVTSAQHEVLALDAPPYAQLASPSGTERERVGADTDVAQVLARGVTFRRVVAQDGLDVPGRLSGIRELADAGMAVRVRSSLPTKLLVIDGETALLPPTPAADPGATALVLRGGLLAHVVVPLFEALWADAVPLGGPARDAGDGPAAGAPSAEDRELLAHLAGGLKDEAIARDLGVHVATARRRIAALLRRLGATSRFQAGVQAARRGWLDG